FVQFVDEYVMIYFFFFFFQAEDGIRDRNVTGVQTCALPILMRSQVCQSSGSVRNTAPPNCTIRNCPAKIANTINSMPYDLESPLNAESVVPNTRALKRFQNCRDRKSVV